jgi:hypothetical protein
MVLPELEFSHGQKTKNQRKQFSIFEFIFGNSEIFCTLNRLENQSQLNNTEMKIANKNARHYVEQKEEFQGSNLYAEKRGNNYIVFSYGTHFPIFAYVKGIWYENEDKYSVSTTRHQSQARPWNVETIKISCREMKNFI